MEESGEWREEPKVASPAMPEARHEMDGMKGMDTPSEKGSASPPHEAHRSAKPASSGGKQAAPKPAPKPEKAAQKYTCPMHPEVVEDHPGKCPKCGMDLVPV
jgi:hypothetical protein